ncbi:MAG: hypothetical protein CSA75_05355, partial [Sorangium cellulosum]
MIVQSPPLSKTSSRRLRIVRGLGIMFGLFAISIVVLWVAIHHISWLGPTIADGTRAVVGPAPVAWVEDIAYEVQDRVNRWRHGDDAPHTYWDVSGVSVVPSSKTSAAPTQSGSGTGPKPLPLFPPQPFKPPYPHLATMGDGVWVPIRGRAEAKGSSTMVKSMVHPDRERPYTVLAIVAMDLSRIQLDAMAGTLEPRDPDFPKRLRIGRVPSDRLNAVIAAFNGGFQTIHGGYAMMVDGYEIGKPREDACTVALYNDGTIDIQSWPKL